MRQNLCGLVLERGSKTFTRQYEKHLFCSGTFWLPIVFLLIALKTIPVNADVLAKFESVSLAVVDFRGVLAKSDAAVAIRKKVDIRRTVYKKKFSEIENKLRKEEKILSKKRAIITAEAFEKRARELKKKARVAQKHPQATNQLLKKTFDQAMNKVRKELLRVIAEVAEETGTGVVLFRSAIVIAVKKLEISQEVLKRLNRKLPTVEVVFAEKQ
jgi:outer membrane protein